MKINAIKFLFLFVYLMSVNFSCVNSKTVSENKTQFRYAWSFPNKDSGILGKLKPDRDCFPGLKEISHKFYTIEISVYNRWGQLMFNSKSFNDNWICKNTLKSKIAEGVYFYILNYSSKKTKGKVIKEDGQINVEKL